MIAPRTTAGLLLATLLAAPLSAQASTLCDDLDGVTAVSPYVQQVLDRARSGLSYAQSAPQDEADDPSGYWLSLATEAGATVLTGVDTQRRITTAVQDLTEISSCLRFDQMLLSCEIEKVRSALNDELSLTKTPNPNSTTVFELQELLLFLFDRDRHLRAGALDPWYADPDWGRTYSFDSPQPGFCCRSNEDGLSCEADDFVKCDPGDFWKTSDDCEQSCGITAFPKTDPRVCPYDSDYSAVMEGGYGCDLSVLSAHLAGTGMSDERNALQQLSDAVDRLRQQAALDGGVTASSASSHAQALTGCASTFGHCSDDAATTCKTDSDCIDGGSCVYQQGSCLNNPTRSCTLDSDCTNASGASSSEGQASVCLLPPTSPPPTVIRRGPFSLNPDQLRLLARYMSWNTRVGANRPFGAAVTDPREEDASSSAFVDPVDYLLNQGARAYFRTVGADLGALQARLEPLVEPSDRLSTLLLPLRSVVATFSTLASQPEGLRKLDREFSYYLRRSCLGDACETDLERTWSIANAQACFPYADGTYLNDACQAGDSIAQQCASAAGIDIEVPECSSSSVSR